MTEVEKPADLAGARRRLVPGVRRPGAVAAEIHVGVEDPFAPARKAHPASCSTTSAELEATAAAWARSASRWTTASATRFPGHARCHTYDGARQPGRGARRRPADRGAAGATR